MTNSTPTTITHPLLLELIKTISENTDELHKLRAEVHTLASEKRALARDVACMSRGMEEFRENFQPYLQRAVESERMWQERRRNWVTMIVGTAILSALGIMVYALGDYAVATVAAKLAAKK